MPGKCVVAESNEEMKQLITENKTAIGYLGFSYSEDGLVGVIALDGVKPTAETIKNGSYELARDLYFYTYGDAKPGVLAFIDFMIGPEGRKIAEAHGFVPL
jgi:phosphate transport system substrate-binding protein